MGKNRFAVIVVLLVTVVIVSVSFYVLILKSPHEERPITAGPDQISLNLADLPSGWTVLRTESNNYDNSSAEYGFPGWNWWTASTFNYSSDGKTCNVYFSVSSENSTEVAHEQYAGTLSSFIGFTYTNISLGDEGCIILLGRPPFHDGTTRDPYYADICFRLGNILVDGEFTSYDWDISNETAWMKAIMDVQAVKIYQNELK